MTKNELAEQVARRNGLPASQARQVLEAAIEVISDELAAGGEVALAGFGKFSVSHRAARHGTQPVDRRRRSRSRPARRRNSRRRAR